MIGVSIFGASKRSIVGLNARSRPGPGAASPRRNGLARIFAKNARKPASAVGKSRSPAKSFAAARIRRSRVPRSGTTVIRTIRGNSEIISFQVSQAKRTIRVSSSTLAWRLSRTEGLPKRSIGWSDFLATVGSSLILLLSTALRTRSRIGARGGVTFVTGSLRSVTLGVTISLRLRSRYRACRRAFTPRVSAVVSIDSATTARTSRSCSAVSSSAASRRNPSALTAITRP